MARSDAPPLTRTGVGARNVSPYARDVPTGGSTGRLGRESSFNERGLNPDLVTILDRAAAVFPLATKAFSGVAPRASGTSNHPGGHAVDLYIYLPDGTPLANSPQRAARTGQNLAENFRIYEAFAQTARDIQQRDFPQYGDVFRWGGYFSPGSDTPFDLMHFDVNPFETRPWLRGAMGVGSWENGLTDAGFKALPGAKGMKRSDISVGMAAAAENLIAALGFTGADAVKRFQAANGLDPDGVIGPLTMAAVTQGLNIMPPGEIGQNAFTPGAPALSAAGEPVEPLGLGYVGPEDNQGLPDFWRGGTADPMGGGTGRQMGSLPALAPVDDAMTGGSGRLPNQPPPLRPVADPMMGAGASGRAMDAPPPLRPSASAQARSAGIPGGSVEVPNRAPRTRIDPFNAEIPPGPYGADDIVRAVLTGDVDAVRAAGMRLQDNAYASVTGDGSLGGMIGAGVQKMFGDDPEARVRAEVEEYFRVLGDRDPMLGQAVYQQISATPGMLQDLTPEAQQGIVDGLRRFAPSDTTSMPMPTLRPGGGTPTAAATGSPARPPLVAGGMDQATMTPRNIGNVLNAATNQYGSDTGGLMQYLAAFQTPTRPLNAVVNPSPAAGARAASELQGHGSTAPARAPLPSTAPMSMSPEARPSLRSSTAREPIPGQMASTPINPARPPLTGSIGSGASTGSSGPLDPFNTRVAGKDETRHPGMTTTAPATGAVKQATAAPPVYLTGKQKDDLNIGLPTPTTTYNTVVNPAWTAWEAQTNANPELRTVMPQPERFIKVPMPTPAPKRPALISTTPAPAPATPAARPALTSSGSSGSSGSVGAGASGAGWKSTPSGSFTYKVDPVTRTTTWSNGMVTSW